MAYESTYAQVAFSIPLMNVYVNTDSLCLLKFFKQSPNNWLLSIDNIKI